MNRRVTIIGQGYVGLPLAQAAASADWEVFGLDTSAKVIAGLREGRSHIDDLSDREISAMLQRDYWPTTDPSVLKESDVVVICVPTPLDDDGLPQLEFVEAACRVTGAHLKKGQLVVLESTTYPGTTEKVVVPILEEHSGKKSEEDFFVAFSPERVDPGRRDFGLSNTPKLVGGVGDQARNAAVAFYETFVEQVVPMRGPREAETAKLLENTFRHVNIALINEMAKFCKQLDIDIWNVIEGAATKPFGFMKFTPGPGVGGHCIPIDPNYLSHEVRRSLGYPFRFVELAQEINNSMPRYIIDRVQGLLNSQRKSLNGSKILLLGVTYKPNIADQRESPALPIAKLLTGLGGKVAFHDPHVSEWQVSDRMHKVVPDLGRAVAEADLVVILQQHDTYDVDAIAEAAQLILDTRGNAPHMHQRL